MVLTDLQMPGIDGLETIERISKSTPKIIAIVMTGHGTIDYAVRAMRRLGLLISLPNHSNPIP